MLWSIEPGAFAQIQRVMAEWPKVAQVAASNATKPTAAINTPITVRNGVAVIAIDGPMINRAPPILAEIFGIASTDSITRAVNAAVADESVRSIMLVIDSPGGSVAGLDALGDAVNAAAKVKRVVAQVHGMAASAAYYAIAGATEIRAGRMDMVGSIGTRLVVFDTSEEFKNAGIEVLTFDTGPLKSAGQDGVKVTDDHKIEFQRIVDVYFEDFQNQVMAGRSMNESQFAAVRTGGIWIGPHAVEMGLVDRISTPKETLEELMNEARQGSDSAIARSRSMRMRARSLLSS